jgi:hypothetical protein
VKIKSVLVKKGKDVPYHAHMAYWGRGGIAPLFLNLGTGRGWVVGSKLRPHLPPGKVPGTHCGRLAGPQNWLDVENRGKILCLHQGSNPSRPVHGQSLHWLSYPATQCQWQNLISELKVWNISITIKPLEITSVQNAARPTKSGFHPKSVKVFKF